MAALMDTAEILCDAFVDYKGLSRLLTFFPIDRAKLKWVIMELDLSEEKIWKVEELKPGDHICYPFVVGDLAYHHAIVKRVLADGRVEVIQHSGPPGNKGAVNKSSNTIRDDKENLSTLASDGKLIRINYGKCDPAEKVIATAEGELGKAGLHDQRYNVFYNNCEHFATWCKIGKAFCRQNGYVQPKQPSVLDVLFPWASIFRK